MSQDMELRDVKFYEGIDHLQVFADIYINDNRVGQVIDDGWCDEIYYEIEDEKYCIDSSRLNDLFVSCRGYRSEKIDSGYYQLLFC